MLNFQKSYLRISPGDPQFFYDLVSGKGPLCVVKFWQELIGALTGDLDASYFDFIRYSSMNQQCNY